MARKQITYAHKRTRNKAKLALQTDSSPLQAIPDPEANLTHSEMTRRMLKRSRQSGSISSTGSPREIDEILGKSLKKTKLYRDDEGPTWEAGIAPQQLVLQTPHSTLLTEEQIFKLKSSRGRTLPSDYEFSPVPLAPSQSCSKLSTGAQISTMRDRTSLKLSHRTSSRNLKENATSSLSRSPSRSATTRPTVITAAGRKNAQASFQRVSRPKSNGAVDELFLASPFVSQSSNPCSPHKGISNVNYKKAKARATAKHTLSDTHYNPNLPYPRTQLYQQAHSTSNSPVNRPSQDDSMTGRRPSAPSATAERPDVASWFVSCNPIAKDHILRDQILSPTIFDLSGAPGRGTSVDFNRPPSQLSYSFTYDEAFAGDALATSTPFVMKAQRNRCMTFPNSPNSPDYEDEARRAASGISNMSHVRRSLQLSYKPDVLSPWMSDSLISPPTLFQECAYNRSFPIDNEADMEALNNGKLDELTAPPSPGESPQTKQGRQATLQELFDSLDLGFRSGASRPQISRTRSLDLELDEPQEGQLLQPPAQISPSKSRIPVPRRDRRGTIRASDFPAPDSSATALRGAPKRTRSGTVVQGPALPRRERSGTILARPSNILVSAAAAGPKDGDVDMDDAEAEAAPQEKDDALMAGDESDDELLLKGPWFDEDWAVAEPPSPEIPRRSNKKARTVNGWQRRYGPGKGLGSWGMEEHDEDDGEDDPLLLK